MNKIRSSLDKWTKRWFEEDYPGAEPRFQVSLLKKDLITYLLVPSGVFLTFKVIEAALVSDAKKAPERSRIESKVLASQPHSQIMNFSKPGPDSKGSLYAPGTLVKVRLLNVVETYSTTPVHAQVIDRGLGNLYLGATLVGDAISDPNSGRIQIDFKFLKHPKIPSVASSISARALSLNGTFGLEAKKKEGVFARAALRSGTSNSSVPDPAAGSPDFKTAVARALASGLLQEFQSDSQVAHNRAQVLTLQPMTEFFVELTDFFPNHK